MNGRHRIVSRSKNPAFFVSFWVAVLLNMVYIPAAGARIAFTEKGSQLDLSPGIIAGMAAADFNGDGFEDLLVGRHISRPPLLLFNDGSGNLQVIDDGIFPNLPRDRDRHVGNAVDFDSDGDKDIYYGSGNQQPHELWQNDGTGLHYVDLWLNIDPQDLVGHYRSGIWFDWNFDRYPDIFMIVGNDEGSSKFGENVGGTGHFLDRTEEVFPDPDTGNQSHGGGSSADYDGDGDVDFFLARSTGETFVPGGIDGRSKLYRQNPDRTFTNVLETVLDAEAEFWVSGARWGDFDNDGDMDLYVAKGYAKRDYGRTEPGDGINAVMPGRLEFFSRIDPEENGDTLDQFSANIARANSLTVDLVDFRFVPPQDPAQVFLGPNKISPAQIPFQMVPTDTNLWGAPVADRTGIYFWLDNNGRTLHYLHQTFESTGVLYSTGSVQTDTGRIKRAVPLNMEGPIRSYPDQLYRNNGDGTFTNVTVAMGIDNVEPAVVMNWSDFDNDGFLDILVVNQHYGIPNNRPFIVYHNNGGAGFEDVTTGAGFDKELNSPYVSMAVADYNSDGYLDLVMGQEAGPPPREIGSSKFYVNQGGSNRWLEVVLVGTASNRDGIGAKLTLTTPQGIQYRQQMGGYHYLGQDSMVVHFGTARVASADLTVEWPSGEIQNLYNIPTNQKITVTEP